MRIFKKLKKIIMLIITIPQMNWKSKIYLKNTKQELPKMTTAFATEKKFYNETLLHTEKGMKLLRESVALQKEWNAYQLGTDVSMGTYGVKLNLIHKNLQPKMKQIEIVPIGLNSQCHTNAEVFTKCGYTSQVGFNLLACPCGRKQTYEIQSGLSLFF